MTNGTRVAVAGATGLAGSAILAQLLAREEPTAIRASRHTTVAPELLDPRLEYVTGDLGTLSACRALAHGCDSAIMAAAYSGGAGVVTGFPWTHFKQQVFLNLQMLEAFQLEGVRRITFVSSATLYQDVDATLNEDDLDLNQDPAPAYMGFGWAVRFVEKTCQMMHERFGIEFNIVRAANIFGPYAKFDPATSNVVPALIRKSVARMDPFEIWGSPDVTRDVIYAEDFGEAVARLAVRPRVGFDIYNVGSGERTTIEQLATWALAAADHRPQAIHYIRDRPSTMKHRVLDGSKIRSTLGWAPKHTVAEGISKTTAWWMANQNTWTR